MGVCFFFETESLFYENGSLFFENGSLLFKKIVKLSPGLAQASLLTTMVRKSQRDMPLLTTMADVQMSCNEVGSRSIFYFFFHFNRLIKEAKQSLVIEV